MEHQRRSRKPTRETVKAEGWMPASEAQALSHVDSAHRLRRDRQAGGLTSHACVARIRRVLGTRRVGHGGTLDPAVTGVLPIAVGQATRLLPYLPGDKTYRGVIQLGVTTGTDDLQGEVLSRKPLPELNRINLAQALSAFRGSIRQRPPQVSAVHVDGERAHARARRGEVMDLPARTVTLHRLELLNWDPRRLSWRWRSTAQRAPTSDRWPETWAKRWLRWRPRPAPAHPSPGVQR